MKKIEQIYYDINREELCARVQDLVYSKKYTLQTIAAVDERVSNGVFKIHYVFGDSISKTLHTLIIKVKDGESVPSLVSTLYQVINYERKIHTFFGIVFEYNPDQRPWNLHTDKNYPFTHIEGEGIYELPVGPIHAGIIEPGHFRFNLMGEEILNLEAHLGYVHKGSEKLFETLSLKDAVKLSEKISGDSSFSHSLAFCQAIEDIADLKLPLRAQYLRVIYAELERIANHLGDSGAIMVDTGYNFGGGNGARLREMVMRLHEHLTGSRFLRGVSCIGGVTKDITGDHVHQLEKDLLNIQKDFDELLEIALNSASLLNRLQTTGITTKEVREKFGVIGIAAKATGLAIDARAEYPYAAYDELGFDEIITESTGDVYARFMVRAREVNQSIDLIIKALHALSKEMSTEINVSMPSQLPTEKSTVSIVEGWRGNIVYFVKTDSSGKLARVDIRDPSFLNWSAVELAGPGNIVPDFPLINKSFNMSYSGNDL